MESGILPLYKPAGHTSHDMVVKARKWLQTREVGHTGTLDPAVTGVLLLCIGRATKLVPMLMERPKAYEGIVSLGATTTTEDAEGEILDEVEVSHAPTAEAVDHVLKQFNGEITQIPPMYSAVKVKGKRLYEYAREGIEVERPKRQVTIYDAKRTGEISLNGTSAHFPISVMCSKGTYIRTFAVDVGHALGFPAHLHSLTRTMSAGVKDSQCVTAEQMEAASLEERMSYLLPISETLQHLPHMELSDSLFNLVKNGAVLDVSNVSVSFEQKLVFTYQGTLVAIYEHHPNKPSKIKPNVMLRRPS
ncbi:hypothetical protein DH09_04955 [Bacillaceae bacterium JMAK1]|nr:hypothetical protein DH09_04955 [Bacillaceae bacterium JMAK1]